MPEPICVKLGMYIMAPEHISMAYFINRPHQSACLYVHPHIIARQWLHKNVTVATSIHAAIKKIVACIVFYVAHAISKERRQLVLPRNSSCFVSVQVEGYKPQM
jgi:hypothetical protein